MPAVEDPTQPSWAYASSRMPDEPPVRFPDKPPDPNALPEGTRSYQLTRGIDAFQLPGGVSAYRVSPEYQARMQQLDQQAAAAKRAGQQAAQDAQMYNMMVRVARSTKDIEIAKRSIDVMGLQNDIQSGVPIHEAVARHPMALGTGFGSALQHTAPTPATTWVSPTGGAPGYVRDPRGAPHFPPVSISHQDMSTEARPVTTPDKKVIGYAVPTGPGTQRIVQEPKTSGKLSTDIAQEVAWRNADIKAAQTQKANLIKAGTRGDAPDIVKLDQAIEENKNAVRALQTPAGTVKASTTGKRVNVIGPNGRRGTVLQGTKLPEGWKIQP